MVICLERGADLHMAQLMPLPLTVSCFSKIQIGFTFLVPAHPGSPDKGPLNGGVCVCVCVFCPTISILYCVQYISIGLVFFCTMVFVIALRGGMKERLHLPVGVWWLIRLILYFFQCFDDVG